MTTVADICDWMNQQAPLALSESWDNTGLLLGDPNSEALRVQTCLTITPETAEEAIQAQASLIVAHHPLPFKPLKRITTDSHPGKLIWQLAGAGIAVYSPHTAWDSAKSGINAMLAELLGLQQVRPLISAGVEDFQDLGSGRIGQLPEPVRVTEVARRLKGLIPDCRPRGVENGGLARTIGIACGSGGSLMEAAIRENCDLFLTGEATFHTCLEAQAAQISLLMIGHFASERFSLVELAERLNRDFPTLDCWASQRERDPVCVLD